jgi:hypothetical protein
VSKKTFPLNRRRFNFVIETPKGSRNKFAFAPELGIFELGKQVRSSRTYPSTRRRQRYGVPPRGAVEARVTRHARCEPSVWS